MTRHFDWDKVERVPLDTNDSPANDGGMRVPACEITRNVGLILGRRETYTPANLDACLRADLALVAVELGSHPSHWHRGWPNYPDITKNPLRSYATKKRLRAEIDRLMEAPTVRRSQLRLVRGGA